MNPLMYVGSAAKKRPTFLHVLDVIAFVTLQAACTMKMQPIQKTVIYLMGLNKTHIGLAKTDQTGPLPGWVNRLRKHARGHLDHFSKNQMATGEDRKYKKIAVADHWQFFFVFFHRVAVACGFAAEAARIAIGRPTENRTVASLRSADHRVQRLGAQRR